MRSEGFLWTAAAILLLVIVLIIWNPYKIK